MARPLPPGMDARTSAQVTEPVYLVDLDVDPNNLRYTNGPTVIYDGATYLESDVRVRISATPTISITNENLQLGYAVLSNLLTGRQVDIYQYYEDTQYLVHLFNGQMGPPSVGDRVVIRCKRYAPLKTPRTRIAAPLANWVPKKGTRFVTVDGTITLE